MSAPGQPRAGAPLRVCTTAAHSQAGGNRKAHDQSPPGASRALRHER